MMRRGWQSILLLIAVQLLAPLIPVFIANLLRFSYGNGFEPLADNLIGYGLGFAAFFPACLAVGVYHQWRGPSREAFEDAVRYAGVGAAGSALLMLVLDFLDDYFSGFGVSLVWSAIGFVAGALFGAAYRGLYGLLLRRAD